MQLIKKILPAFIIILYFFLHFPFLTSDPDTMVDPFMRHAWTDEGLYSSQIRNYVDHGSFDIQENSTFVRGPLFNIIQYPFFSIFGTNLIVGRLIVLLFTVFILFLFLHHPKLRNFGFYMLLFALLEYHIFQFTHYSMAELMCIDFILLGLYFLFLSRQYEHVKKKNLMIFLSTFFMFCSYCTKVQFLYVGAIVPATLFFLSLNTSLYKKNVEIKNFYPFFWSMAFSAFFAGLYYFAWFLPNKDFYIS